MPTIPLFFYLAWLQCCIADRLFTHQKTILECRQLNDSARAIKVASQIEEGATAENIVQPASVLNVRAYA